MTAKLWVNFAPPPSLNETCKTTALRMVNNLEGCSRGNGHAGEKFVYVQGIQIDEPDEVARLTTRYVNDTLDRLRYVTENPDAALSFVNDSPVLIATDASGIDHETLFKLGREVRS